MPAESYDDDEDEIEGPKSSFGTYLAEGDALFKQSEFKKALESYSLVSFFYFFSIIIVHLEIFNANIPVFQSKKTNIFPKCDCYQYCCSHLLETGTELAHSVKSTSSIFYIQNGTTKQTISF